MKITIHQAHFFDLKAIGDILPLPSFIEVDLRSSSFGRDTEYFVAKVGGEIIGFLQLTKITSGESEIVRLYILPDYHRKGIGTLLVRKCFKLLVKGTRLTVKVEKTNLKAVAFYEHLGFKKIREIYNSYGDNLYECWLYI